MLIIIILLIKFFSYQKKDNIYFDYIKNDYIKYINKIFNDEIDDKLKYFIDIKLFRMYG